MLCDVMLGTMLAPRRRPCDPVLVIQAIQTIRQRAPFCLVYYVPQLAKECLSPSQAYRFHELMINLTDQRGDAVDHHNVTETDLDDQQEASNGKTNGATPKARTATGQGTEIVG